MKASELVVRMVVSRLGASVDRTSVRLTGHSFVSWVFARAEGVTYNAPSLLTTVGAITGRKRTVVLPSFLVGDKECVVASRGGAPTDPHWARNLRANSLAWLRTNRRQRAVQAVFAQGEDREELWREITDRAPIYLEYQARARNYREIPVIVLKDA